MKTDNSGKNDKEELDKITNALLEQSKDLLNECLRFAVDIENLDIADYVIYDNYEFFRKKTIPTYSRQHFQNMQEVKNY